MSLDVLYEDAHLIAVRKPAGLLSQGRSGGEPTLETLVRSRLYPRGPASGFLGTIHRLDRPVSGVVLWAITPKAARRVAEQFAAREVAKQYWCVVDGPAIPLAGVWEDWLREDELPLGRVRVSPPDFPGAKKAVTRFECIETANPVATDRLLRLFPETGRTHQLRVQTSSRGLPIRGDSLYGSLRAFPDGIALHARSLSIRHPILGSNLEFVAELPASWREAGIIFP